MVKIIFVIIFLQSTGCTKRQEVATTNGTHYGVGIYAEVERVIEVPWKVGLKREMKVSQGIRFFTTIPLFSDEAKDILISKYGVDSWLFRFTRVRRGKKARLKYFNMKFSNMTRNTKNISVSLFYQAAAVSKKFRFFHCPAFDHRYQVSSYQLLSRPNSEKEDLFVRSVEKVRAKVVRFKYSPMIIPGGRSLKGDYYVDMAFYSSGAKQRFSNWLPVNGVIRVNQENSRIIASCGGIKEEYDPLPKSRLPDITDFEIR